MLILSGLLVVFHTPSNAGYAMAPLEKMFFQVACELTGDPDKVHFAFCNLSSGMPTSLPENFSNVIALDKSGSFGPEFQRASDYIRQHDITIALCFDLQPRADLCVMLRNAGVIKLFSYLGSSISSVNKGIKLMLKRCEVALTRSKPDLFIFESEAMRFYAVHGRGIRLKNTCVIPTGVDTDRFFPNESSRTYLDTTFSIPAGKQIVFYSGHMEERKGVHVIIAAAIELIDKRRMDHIFFLICGNRAGEEQPFLDMLKGTRAESNVLFGGYRTDLHKIMPGCDLGVIASTGWDSFPMSSLEMAACGLPLVVSALEGLVETIEDRSTGFLFEPGNSIEMADKIAKLDADKHLSRRFSMAARNRIVSKYTLEHQRKSLKLHLANAIES